MDNELLMILDTIGIEIDSATMKIKEQLIPREVLLSNEKYENIREKLPNLRKVYSSSRITGLHKNADKVQKWPLLNLVRQLLHKNGYKMEPVRKADGYTLDGVKKYRRYFLIIHL